MACICPRTVDFLPFLAVAERLSSYYNIRSMRTIFQEVAHMPIKIPDSLPARAVLEGENIFVMTEYRAMHQDIRPLNVLILNLMPTKIVTETQLLRKLSNTPLQIQVELLRTSSYHSRNTDSDHLDFA